MGNLSLHLSLVALPDDAYRGLNLAASLRLRSGCTAYLGWAVELPKRNYGNRCGRRMLSSIWVLSLFICVHCLASTKQAQFFDQSTNFTFVTASSVNRNNETVLSFRVSAPDTYGWVAIGTGERMGKSLMFVVYASGNADNPITLSSRTTSGHDLPYNVNNVNSKLLSSSHATGMLDATFQLQMSTSLSQCSNIDLLSQSQPWIWAVGPENTPISSTSQDVSIQKHSQCGVIFIDMTQTFNFNTPSQVFQTANPTSSSSVRSQPSSYHTLVVIHALLLGTSFIVVFPLGVIGLRFQWKKWNVNFQIHWTIQVVATVASFLGLMVAITMSIIGIKYSHFNQSHQVIGIVIVSLLSAQASMGCLHHKNFKEVGQRTWVSYVHIFGGRIVIYVGMVNAILGFILSSSSTAAVAAAVVSVLFAAALEYKAIRNQRNRHNINGSIHGGQRSGSRNLLTDNYVVLENGRMRLLIPREVQFEHEY